MKNKKFEAIKQEYNMTLEDIDRAIGVVIALMDAEIEELEKECSDYDEIGALDKAADEVANLLGKIELAN